MTRLVHSEAGLLRSLQISKNTFFAFVEGALDRPFFDRLLSRTFANHVISPCVIAAKELPGATGGKPALLGFFETMRRKGQLVCDVFGKRQVCVFLPDKDVDDLTRKQYRSEHVVYTSTYDIEGHLFNCGDLSRAIADACGTTVQQAKEMIGDQKVWIDRHVNNWKEWTVLCLISQVKKVNCGCTFDRASAINPDFLQPPDIAKLNQFKGLLQQKLLLDQDQFARLFTLYARTLNRTISVNTPLRYFKGKWLKIILEHHLRQGFLVADANLNGSGERVVSTLVAQVGVREDCDLCNYYYEPLLKLANKFA